MFNVAVKLIRSTKVEVCTTAPIFANTVLSAVLFKLSILKIKILKMEYIIITNYSNRSYQCEENDNGFIEKFSNYEDALLYAQQYELEDFEILGLCTKEKNHII
jgi:hypothetical protein